MRHLHRLALLGASLVACDGGVPVADAGTSPPGSGETGDPCTDATACTMSHELCLTMGMSMTSFPDGYCSTGCMNPGEDCGTGGVCDGFPGVAYKCFRRCSRDADCRTADGYTCQPGALFTTEQICLPPWTRP